jgi:hypothetical protein
MATLILTNRPIASFSSGYDLRVFHLCRAIEDELHLVVAPVDALEFPVADIDAGSVFSSIRSVDFGPARKPSWRRHARIDEDHFLELAYPAAFDQALSAVRGVAASTGAQCTIVFGSNLAGLARRVGIGRVLFDVCDSVSLRMRRQHASDGAPSSLAKEHGRLDCGVGRGWRGFADARWHSHRRVRGQG